MTSQAGQITPALARLRAIYAQRHRLPADTGGVVGCLTPAAPLELILAAGLQPLRLQGDPSRPPRLGDTYMEPEVDGEVRSLFDRFLAGDFAALPLVLMSRTSEAHLQLTYYLDEVTKWTDCALPPRRIVDVLQTPQWMTGRYVRDRFAELAQVLGGIGTPVTDASLRDAIAQVNAMRQALQRLNMLRRGGQIRGSDMQRITALYGVLAVPDFLALAGDLADAAGPGQLGPRVMLSGTAQDDTGIYDALEAVGAHVVADDHVHGERVYAHLVDATADPLDALAEHYQLHAPGIRQSPQKAQDARFLSTCRDAGVQADLCVLEDCDDTLGWDWPRRRDALAGTGIPSALLTGERYFAPDADRRRAAIDDLLARIAEGAA